VADVCAFIEAHKSAHGLARLTPKHDFSVHTALRFQTSVGEVVDCFVHERKHQAMKQAANPVKNTTAFETSVLSRSLLEEARQFDALPFERGLVGRAMPHPELGAALGMSPVRVANGLRCNGLQVRVGDIVLFRSEAGIVRMCGQCDGFLFVVVTLLECARRSNSSSCWTAKANRDQDCELSHSCNALGSGAPSRHMWRVGAL